MNLLFDLVRFFTTYLLMTNKLYGEVMVLFLAKALKGQVKAKLGWSSI